MECHIAQLVVAQRATIPPDAALTLGDVDDFTRYAAAANHMDEHRAKIGLGQAVESIDRIIAPRLVFTSRLDKLGL